MFNLYILFITMEHLYYNNHTLDIISKSNAINLEIILYLMNITTIFFHQ